MCTFDVEIFTLQQGEEKDGIKTTTEAGASSMSNASFMELLTENANLRKKIALLLEDGDEDKTQASPPQWKKELELAERKITDLSQALEDRLNEVHLIEEKNQLQELNHTLVEKIQLQAEELIKKEAALTDAKDQADLLEFRVLELEEDNEKLKTSYQDINDTDSGCNSSMTTESISEADIMELHQDFKNEKVADTKSRLHRLMLNTPQTQDKSLLIQTVALFEALLSKIDQLQDENESMKKELSNNKELQDLTKDRDAIVLELELKRSELEKAQEMIIQLTTVKHSYEEQLEKSETKNTKHNKMEDVLQKQIHEVQSKLDSANKGRQAESEMAQEALKKASQLERSVLELQAKLKALMDENTDLKEQLYEQHTTKSCDSGNEKVLISAHTNYNLLSGFTAMSLSCQKTDCSDA